MLDKAIISMKAKFDDVRMQYLARTCKKLKYLEFCGNGVIGDSLTRALPLVKSLETIVLGKNCEISLAATQSVLKICQQTLVEATFLRVKGSIFQYVPDQWPELQSLQTLNLRSSGDVLLDLVSTHHYLDHYITLDSLTNITTDGTSCKDS
jgi:hypothetical protein